MAKIKRKYIMDFPKDMVLTADRKFLGKSYTPFDTSQGNKTTTISEMEIFQESYTDICQVGRSSLPSQISSPAMM